jgi:hypothetical protein
MVLPRNLKYSPLGQDCKCALRRKKRPRKLKPKPESPRQKGKVRHSHLLSVLKRINFGIIEIGVLQYFIRCDDGREHQIGRASVRPPRTVWCPKRRCPRGHGREHLFYGGELRLPTIAGQKLIGVPHDKRELPASPSMKLTAFATPTIQPTAPPRQKATDITCASPVPQKPAPAWLRSATSSPFRPRRRTVP